jgi:8-oxo-dGTP diphosphatase
MSETSNDFPDCFYRVTIKAMCVRDGKLLLVRESTKSGQKWELPGGGLDFGEDILTALRRETKEETGLRLTKVSQVPVYVWTRKSENNRGLDWFYSCVLVYRVEFEDLNFILSEECEAVEFFDAHELAHLPLSGQLQPLKELFNPADFKDPF